MYRSASFPQLLRRRIANWPVNCASPLKRMHRPDQCFRDNEPFGILHELLGDVRHRNDGFRDQR